MKSLEKGLSAESTTIVCTSNSALSLGSGDMEVFATPAMVALMENAAMRAVAEALPEGSTTVGTEMTTSHIKASKMGAKITATAVVTEVNGRQISFNVGAVDEAGIIGEGTHTRFIVDRAKFMAKVQG